MTQVTNQTLLTQYLSEVQKIYGSHLKSVILYASYAQGDYTSNYDVDIMLLVDLTPEEMDDYSGKFTFSFHTFFLK
ncbi:MAG: nucleotidyltransferase domain-containing protein [Blautia sp.]|nr:nucleotidyltransferase domain-containing protein [Blautia sp.]MDY5032386.1 nucleotidyltransferase domain-containing protein [Blautia sp.]